MAEELVAVGLNVKVYVDDALTILFVIAKMHEAALIFIKELCHYKILP